MPPTFIIQGPPRTKKNSQRIVQAGKRRFVVQSKQYVEWEKHAVLQLQSQWHKPALMWPVNMKAVIYRDRDVGDLLNFLAAVSDALEKAGVIGNDRQVVGLNGSEMELDRERPRVEVELTEEGAQ